MTAGSGKLARRMLDSLDMKTHTAEIIVVRATAEETKAAFRGAKYKATCKACGPVELFGRTPERAEAAIKAFLARQEAFASGGIDIRSI